MLKLILRQVLKHWFGLLPVIALWIVGGFYIFQNRHRTLAFLSGLVVSRPEPGTQNTDKARSYADRARARLSDSGVRLDLMKKACRYRPFLTDNDFVPAHWLEKLREWRLPSDSGIVVVEPDAYWSDHRGVTLLVLKDLIDAAQYGYEWEEDAGEGKPKQLFVLPRLASDLAQALCRPDLELLFWGDYAAFQEARAFREIRTADPDFEELYALPDEQELFVLERLKKNDLYLEALARYAGGAFREDCQAGTIQLACAAPLEAIRVHNKRLYFTPKEETPPIYLTLGRIHLHYARDLKDPARELKRARDRFAGSLEQKNLELESRLGLARVYLLEKDLEKAYDQVKSIASLLRGRSLTDGEFRTVARAALTALGRHKDADCFADLSELRHGAREHCETFRF